jgi:arylformamidase
MNAWVDASLSISNESLVWPGDAQVYVRPTVQISAGDMCNESRIEIGSHSTTHIDAPRHFDETGLCVDELDPKVLVGPAWVVQLSSPRLVGTADLQEIPAGEFTRVIIKTRNSDFLGTGAFREDYVGLAEDAARYLVDHGCKLVGIDYYSICPIDDVVTVHQILLRQGVAIVEALVLRDVRPGPVDIIALPLKIRKGDASPARVLIRGRT